MNHLILSSHPDLAQSTMQKAWLFVGAGGMALGAVAIAVLGTRLARQSHHAVTSFFVCAIAACLYLLMAFGQGVGLLTDHSLLFHPGGVIDTVSARLVYFGRYIDWVFTTPLLLVGLIGVGMAHSSREAGRSRGSIIGAAIGADVLMIVTGLLGSLSLSNGHKYTWFAISCVFFLIVLGVIWGPVRAAAAAQGPAVAGLYNRLLGTLTALWFIYPVLWLLGTEGTSSISLSSEVVVFTIIDLTAKVGFGLLLVTGVRKLSPATEEVHRGVAVPAAA